MRVTLPAKTDGRHWVWCRERGWGPQHTTKSSPEAHLCSVHSAPRLPTPAPRANYVALNCTNEETEAQQAAPGSRSRSRPNAGLRVRAEAFPATLSSKACSKG